MELEKGAQELGRGVEVDVEDLDDARVLDGHGCGEPSEAIGGVRPESAQVALLPWILLGTRARARQAQDQSLSVNPC